MFLVEFIVLHPSPRPYKFISSAGYAPALPLSIPNPRLAKKKNYEQFMVRRSRV